MFCRAITAGALMKKPHRSGAWISRILALEARPERPITVPSAVHRVGSVPDVTGRPVDATHMSSLSALARQCRHPRRGHHRATVRKTIAGGPASMARKCLQQCICVLMTVHTTVIYRTVVAAGHALAEVVASTMPVDRLAVRLAGHVAELAGVQRRPATLDASTASPRGVAAHPRTRGQSPARGRGWGKNGG
jgi:hypothetical protein